MLPRPPEVMSISMPIEVTLALFVLTILLYLGTFKRGRPFAVACAILTLHAGGMMLSQVTPYEQIEAVRVPLPDEQIGHENRGRQTASPCFHAITDLALFRDFWKDSACRCPHLSLHLQA